MWVLIFLFGLTTLVLGWTCFGYFIFLWIFGLTKKERRSEETTSELPYLSIIVPCYNEEVSIEEKLDNLKKQQYPRQLLEVIFADGGSQDSTVELLEKAIADISYMRLVRCPKKGKINQLNHVLSLAKGSIIVNTDVDGAMNEDCLLMIAEEFRRDSNIYVVGACSTPLDISPVDSYYWLSQNQGRVLESNACTSSIVVAVCYAFKKDMISGFPDDVVADDIYIAYLANTLGKRTIYSTKAIAVETRGAKDTDTLIAHKFRKSIAFLKETLRFAYRLPEMPGLWRLMFLTKLSQLFFLPWLSVLWAIIAICLLSVFRFDVVFLGTVFLIVFLLSTSRIFKSIHTSPKKSKYGLRVMAVTYLMSVFILIITGLSYPFFKQDSCYKRTE